MSLNKDLQTYWNKSSSTIPQGKDPSVYGISKEKLFPRQSVVCDLGGGSGADSLYFAGKGHRVKLIDISDAALLQANIIAKKQGATAYIETIQSDMSQGVLPLGDETCDVIYSRLALHYFESYVLVKLFTEVYRMLKPRGKAYLTIKSPDDKAEMEYLAKHATQIENGVFEENGFIKTRYSIEQLKSLLSNSRIPAEACSVRQFTEDLSGRKDKVKSGNMELIVNEIMIAKA